MAIQLSFLKKLFSCDNSVCKSGGEAAFKVTTTYFPHGKEKPKAWTNIELLCQECTEKLKKQMHENPFICEYNDISIEKI